MLNTELLAQAARDTRLSHGAFRLLALMQTVEPSKNNPGTFYAHHLGVCSTKHWREQLRSYGYIPDQRSGHRFTRRQQESSYDLQNENAQVPEIGTAA